MIYSALLKIKIFVFEHYLGLLVALTVGFVMFLPQLLLIFSPENNYQGIHIAETDNDFFYNSRINRAYEDPGYLSEAAMKGTADEPYTSPFLGENFVAGIAKLLFLEPRQMMVLSLFLFPFLLSLAFYFLTFRITGSKLVSVIVPLAIVLSSNFVFDPRNFIHLFADRNKLLLNIYNRPIHPQVSSLFFYTWLIFLYLWHQTRYFRYVWGAAALLGAMFYIYPFSWILALAIVGVLGVGFVVKKNYRAALGLATMTGLGLVISIPNWINYYHFTQHEFFDEMRKRVVLLPSRTPIWSNLLFLDFLILLAYWRKKGSEFFSFLLSAVVASFLVINQQIITGVRLFPGHWHWYYIVPLTIVLVTATFFDWLKSKAKRFWQTVSAAALIALFVFNGAAAQLNYYQTNRLRYRDYQRFMPVYQWLEQSAPKDSVILAEGAFSILLPVYTPHFRYIYEPTDELYLIPRERLKDTFFVKIYLEGARPDNVSEFISQNTHELREILHGYLRRYTHGCYQCYPEHELRELRREYVEFYNDDLERRLKKYELDYIVQDTSKNAIIDVGKYKFVELQAEIEGFKIYRVI